MDILSYLTTLIKTHKEVGIPGLGTIYKKKSPGRYDIATHSFLPPSYSLAFTSDLNEQTLLTGMITRKKNISIDAATYFVEQFSQNVLDELSSHQESDFGEIGTFSTAAGSLVFIPKEERNFGFEFYGLPTLKDGPDEEETLQVSEEQIQLENNNADLSDGTEHLPDLPKETTTDDSLLSHLDISEPPAVVLDEEKDEQPVYQEVGETIETPAANEIQAADTLEKTPEDRIDSSENQVETPEHKKETPAHEIETPENHSEVVVPPNAMQQETTAPTGHFALDYTESKPPMSGMIKLAIGLVALILIIGSIYLAKPELFQSSPKAVTGSKDGSSKTHQKTQDIEQAKLDSIARIDSIRKSNEMAILAADSAKDSTTVSSPVEQITPTGISYEIIAASLINQKEADRFLADMKRKGIPAKVANMPGRRVKISIGSFSDEETARKQLEILKKTTKIPGIYIYPVKHTNNSK